MLWYSQTLGILSFPVLPPHVFLQAPEPKGQTWRLLKLCSFSSTFRTLCLAGGGTSSLDEGEVKVILLVCPYHAFKKTPVCRIEAFLQQQNKGAAHGSMCERLHCMKKRNCIIEAEDTLNTFLLFSVSEEQNNWLVGLCLYVWGLTEINNNRNQFKEADREPDKKQGDEKSRCLNTVLKANAQLASCAFVINTHFRMICWNRISVVKGIFQHDGKHDWIPVR